MWLIKFIIFKVTRKKNVKLGRVLTRVSLTAIYDLEFWPEASSLWKT